MKISGDASKKKSKNKKIKEVGMQEKHEKKNVQTEKLKKKTNSRKTKKNG